jgi:K+-transporting ATPase ATPase A chain
MGNHGIHGLIEVIYAFTSMGNNNGSSFAGLNANTPFYNILGGLIMLIGRYWIAIPVLAIAGSLVKKKHTPPNAGTLMTCTPIFIIMSIGVIYLLGALSYLPAFSQGPIIEHLLLWGGI